MLRTAVNWVIGHSAVTDPYAAAALVGALVAAVFAWLWDHLVPWLRFQLRRPVTLAYWLCWPFSGTARRRYRIGTARKDITYLQGLAAAVHGDLADTHGRLADLLDAETGAAWPLEPVR